MPAVLHAYRHFPCRAGHILPAIYQPQGTYRIRQGIIFAFRSACFSPPASPCRRARFNDSLSYSLRRGNDISAERTPPSICRRSPHIPSSCHAATRCHGNRIHRHPHAIAHGRYSASHIRTMSQMPFPFAISSPVRTSSPSGTLSIFFRVHRLPHTGSDSRLKTGNRYLPSFPKSVHVFVTTG